MSASMHMHVERKVDGNWVYVPDPKAKPRAPIMGSVPPTDWYSSRRHQDYDVMAVLAGVRNHDGFKPIAAWRGFPEDASAELKGAFEWHDEGGATSLLVSEIRAYDFDQTVSKPARLYSAEEIAELGWGGNGPGKPYLDIARHNLRGEIEHEGYTPQDFPVRQFVERFLNGLLVEIEQTAGVPPEDIRLTLWFS